MLGLKTLDEFLGVLVGHGPLLLEDGQEGLVNILGHVFGITADVDVSSLLKKAPEVAGILEDEVLDIDLFDLLPGESHAEDQLALGLELLELILVDEVKIAVTAAKVKHIGGTGGDLVDDGTARPLLQEGPEGGNSGSGPNHDHWHIRVGGQSEIGVLSWGFGMSVSLCCLFGCLFLIVCFCDGRPC